MTREKCTQIRRRGLDQAPTRLFGGPADMGRDNTVFGVEQRIINRRRLARQDLNGSTGQAPLVERVGKVLLDNQGSARRINQKLLTCLGFGVAPN